VGHFGGIGELSQGFCRACAVAGGVYILGRPFDITRRTTGSVQRTTLVDSSTVISSSSTQNHSNEEGEYKFQITMDEVKEPLRAKVLLSSWENLPDGLKTTGIQKEMDKKVLGRGIVVLDGPVYFKPPGRVVRKEDVTGNPNLNEEVEREEEARQEEEDGEN
jgi:hypothetical protein